MKKLKYIILILFIVVFRIIISLNDYKPINSLVFIESIGDDFIKEGMGFVYKIENNNNYIVTNYHVIDNNDYVYVYNHYNDKVVANIVDYDIYSDIAILEIEDKLDLKEAKININNVKENDEINYFNIRKSNIKSAKVLSLDNEIILNSDYGNSFYNAISIDGDIARGNSGGAIFNVNNEVIGLISLMEDNNNIGFYIPIGYVMNIVTKLENHELIRPNLGAVFANTTNSDILNEYEISVDIEKGVVILAVTEDYPLNKTGLVKGDVITKVNNVIIDDVNDLQREIYSCNIGDTITLEYYRDNKANKVDVVLDK